MLVVVGPRDSDGDGGPEGGGEERRGGDWSKDKKGEVRGVVPVRVLEQDGAHATLLASSVLHNNTFALLGPRIVLLVRSVDERVCLLVLLDKLPHSGR